MNVAKVGVARASWLGLGVVLLAAGFIAGCRKAAQTDERKARVEVDVWLEPRERVAEHEVVAAEPPKALQSIERAGMRIVVVGIPTDGDPLALFDKAASDGYQAGSNATIVVTRRCLRDLVPAMQKYMLTAWTVALVVGARCDGPVSPTVGAALFVESGSAARVKITFDRRTRAFLRVEPVR